MLERVVEVRRCSWCDGPIPVDARKDAETCSTSCRQARHRFARGVGRAVASHRGTPIRLAYADPPYPKRAKRYYGSHPDYAGEVDHAELITRLSAEFDGWALSTSADALQMVLGLCPPGVRVGAWIRGERRTRSFGPLNAWEPVVFFGGRPDTSGSTSRRLDVLQRVPRARLTDPRWVTGAKPGEFCRWVFDLLGAAPGDEFVDVFPGSGGVGRAWSVFTGPNGGKQG